MCMCVAQEQPARSIGRIQPFIFSENERQKGSYPLRLFLVREARLFLGLIEGTKITDLHRIIQKHFNNNTDEER